MFWENGGDASGTLLDTIDRALYGKSRNNTEGGR
jgi:hypothetical protein